MTEGGYPSNVVFPFDEFRRRGEFEELRRRADEAARHLKANKPSHQFIDYWVPVIQLTWQYTLAAWDKAGEPTNLDGTRNYNSKPLQNEFAKLLTENHPDWAEWWMHESHKPLRSICRDIGDRLDAIITWYGELPEEKRLEWNYPVIVEREYQNAHRSKGKPRRTKHEEDIHELEQRHAETVAAMHAENTKLKAALDSVEELVARIEALGKDAITQAIKLLRGSS
jgi:hypothetical protein